MSFKPLSHLLWGRDMGVDIDCDLGWVEERVVDQAVMDGALDAGAMLVGQFHRSFDFDAEVVDAGGGVFDFVGGDANAGAVGREMVLAQVLGGVVGGAGS